MQSNSLEIINLWPWIEEGSDDYGRSQLKLKEALIKNHAY
jgi:hypothetical protein